MNRRILVWAALVVFLGVGWAEEPVAEGLVVEFRSKKEATSDFRYDRRAALLVEKGEAPTPFLPLGPFEATWRGVLRLQKRERLYFSFEGFGKASLLIDDKVILKGNGKDLSTIESERLRLNGGDHLLEIRYASNESGAGRFRLFWKGRDFARETIPPKAYGYITTSAVAQSTDQATTIRKGRFLAAVYGCSRCHRPDKPFDSATAMPEVMAKAPSLLGVGSRLREEWMANWILNPRQGRPSARMPITVDSVEEAKHLARFLAGLKNQGPKILSLVGDASKGGALFAELGCISCHRIAKGEVSSTFRRISLLEVGSKFLPGALAEFLRAPGQHYPWTRMPDFKLSPTEAADLSAFLRGLVLPTPGIGSVSGDLAKGKALFVARGCAACHESPVKNTLEAPGFATLSKKNGKGCLVNAPNGPRFGFSLEKRKALSSFLRSGEKSLHQRNPQEFAIRQFKELRCMACHERDGIDSQWDTFAGEVSAWKHKEPERGANEENPEQPHRANRTPPSLTFAGEKLRREWIASFLSGEIKDKPRPWMNARMPTFPSRADLVAKGLVRACGVSQEEPQEGALDDLAEVKKIGTQIANVLCLTCHGIGDRGPTAVFEGQGINLLVSRKSLRKEHYLRWMLDPYRINPATIMPKFADEEGRTGLIDLLEGDARRQFDGIWRYLEDLQRE